MEENEILITACVSLALFAVISAIVIAAGYRKIRRLEENLRRLRKIYG